MSADAKDEDQSDVYVLPSEQEIRALTVFPPVPGY